MCYTDYGLNVCIFLQSLWSTWRREWGVRHSGFGVSSGEWSAVSFASTSKVRCAHAEPCSKCRRPKSRPRQGLSNLKPVGLRQVPEPLGQAKSINVGGRWNSWPLRKVSVHQIALGANPRMFVFLFFLRVPVFINRCESYTVEFWAGKLCGQGDIIWSNCYYKSNNIRKYGNLTSY